MSNKAFQESLSQLLDKRKKERLPIQFFISKIHSNLDLTPILTFNQSDIELLAQELPSEIDQRPLMDYIQQNGIKLLNLRQQFLQRFSFSKLNQIRLDQNVEYLNLNQEIDLLVFVSKIRLQAQQLEENTSPQKITLGQRMVRVSIMRGYNFNLLYNGIMPNARVSLPQIGLETELVERSSQPIFNEHINFSPTVDLRKVRIQAYHQPSADAEAILIGQGTLSLVQAISTKELPFSKVTRVILTSSMSNRMQAAIDIKVQVGQRHDVEKEKSFSEIDESIGDSRIQEAMQRINRMNDFRKKVALFESSDED